MQAAVVVETPGLQPPDAIGLGGQCQHSGLEGVGVGHRCTGAGLQGAGVGLGTCQEGVASLATGSSGHTSRVWSEVTACLAGTLAYPVVCPPAGVGAHRHVGVTRHGEGATCRRHVADTRGVAFPVHERVWLHRNHCVSDFDPPPARGASAGYPPSRALAGCRIPLFEGHPCNRVPPSGPVALVRVPVDAAVAAAGYDAPRGSDWTVTWPCVHLRCPGVGETPRAWSTPCTAGGSHSDSRTLAAVVSAVTSVPCRSGRTCLGGSSCNRASSWLC